MLGLGLQREHGSRAVAALSGICFTSHCLYEPLSPTVLYKMEVGAFWCSYPGGNNGKPFLRKAAFGRLLSKALRHPPHAPPPYRPFQCWDEVFFLSGAAWQTQPPTLKWGVGGGECRACDHTHSPSTVRIHSEFIQSTFRVHSEYVIYRT